MVRYTAHKTSSGSLNNGTKLNTITENGFISEIYIN